MSAFKSHQRKQSIKNEVGSPGNLSLKSESASPAFNNKRKLLNKAESDSPAVKNIKHEQGTPALKKVKSENNSPTPAKTPKQNNKKTPKSVNQQKGTPGGKKFNKESPLHATTPKFEGTGKLDFKTPTSDNSTTVVKNEAKLNRHKIRRNLTHGKRLEQRAKFVDLKNKAIQGDAAARKEIELKMAAIEAEKNLSRTKKRKLALFKRILNKDGISQKGGEVQLKKNQSVQPKQKAVAQVSQIKNKEAPKPAQGKKNVTTVKNGKVAQAKKAPVKVEVEDDDEDEEESDDDAAGSAEEDLDDEEGSDIEEEEGDEDDYDDDDDDDDDEDDDDEKDEKKPPISNKKVIPQQQNKAKPVKQQNKPEGPTTSPAKNSRFVVFVQNLPYTATANDIREHFKKVGEIADVRVPTNPDGRPKGFAYVELNDQETYDKALAIHNSTLGGRKIGVLHSESGNKKSQQQKNNMKAKNFNLQASRKPYQGGRPNQKGSPWRGKNNQQ